jgi:hypothetical protein
MKRNDHWYPGTCKCSHASQNYQVFQYMFDGSVYPKNSVKLFDGVLVLRYL